jgi:hypothetical protein
MRNDFPVEVPAGEASGAVDDSNVQNPSQQEQ